MFPFTRSMQYECTQSLSVVVEPLEARQFFSASVHHASDMVPVVGSAVHATVKAENAAPIAIWNATATVTVAGVPVTRKFVLSLLKDEAGVVSARLGGDGLGLSDGVVAGTHDSAGYHFAVTTSKASLRLDAVVGSDGKPTGSLSLTREGKTVTGTFTATVVTPTPKPAPKPAPKPEPKPAPKPTPAPDQGKAVKYTISRSFAGDFTPAGSIKTYKLTIQLGQTSDGVTMVIVNSDAFAVKTYVLMGTKSGDSYTFAGTGEHGSANLSFSVHANTLAGSVSRTDDGKTVAGTFSLAAK